MLKYIPTILFGLFLSANYGFAKIEVEISMDKYEFLEAEPIFLYLKFINNSNFNDSIESYPISEFYNCFKTTGDDSLKIENTGGTGDYIGSIRYVKFKPNEIIYRVINLLNFKANIMLRFSLNGMHSYISNGNYKIKFSYYNLESNEIEFRINKPQGIELRIFEKLLKAYQINDGKPWTIDSILLKRDIYHEIAHYYENSVYWEEAVFRYNEESNYLKMDSIDYELNKKLVNKNPDSYFLSGIFSDLCKYIYKYEGENAIIEYLQNIINNHPNCRAFDLANKQLISKSYSQ